VWEKAFLMRLVDKVTGGCPEEIKGDDMNGANDKRYLYWCNECDWEETMNEHKYDFCPNCGHINISRNNNGKKPKHEH
jgi:predicted RNA-binding Zn-ribbon protein involved in translation (DUF1610 family)